MERNEIRIVLELAMVRRRGIVQIVAEKGIKRLGITHQGLKWPYKGEQQHAAAPCFARQGE
jgi:hypothetical protein